MLEIEPIHFFVSTPESSYPPDKTVLDSKKLINDLETGFRIVDENECRTFRYAEVVTRNGDDLFFVQAETVHDDGDYTRLNLCIRRRKKMPGEMGSATLEVWSSQRSTLGQNADSYRIQDKKGGVLEKGEFLMRYNSSTVDQAATNQYCEIRGREMKKR